MKESNKPMVMRDSPEAASLQTVTGWVSRHGRFYGDAEDVARFDGCTHDYCRKCGAVVERGWTACRGCRDVAEEEKFDAMPRKPWDGVAMLYSQAKDEYYAGPSDAEDALDEGQTLADLRLVICGPNHARPIEEDYFCDELSEDGELPDDLVEAMKVFNEAIEKSEPLSWSPGKFALDISPLQSAQGAINHDRQRTA